MSRSVNTGANPDLMIVVVRALRRSPDRARRFDQPVFGPDTRTRPPRWGSPIIRPCQMEAGTVCFKTAFYPDRSRYASLIASLCFLTEGNQYWSRRTKVSPMSKAF